jgi:hypothetical protein
MLCCCVKSIKDNNSNFYCYARVNEEGKQFDGLQQFITMMHFESICLVNIPLTLEREPNPKIKTSSYTDKGKSSAAIATQSRTCVCSASPVRASVWPLNVYRCCVVSHLVVGLWVRGLALEFGFLDALFGARWIPLWIEGKQELRVQNPYL